MNSKSRKAVLILMAVVMALGVQGMPLAANFGEGNFVYADDGTLSSKLTSDVSAVQGDQKVEVLVEIENKSSGPVTFNDATLELDNSDNISISGGTTAKVTLEKGDLANITFYVSLGKNAETGSRAMTLILNNDVVEVHKNQSLGIFRIYEKTSAPKNGVGNYAAYLDITHSTSPDGGFSQGADNILYIKLKNIGNTVVKNAVLSLTMPDGISINNAGSSYNLGYIGTGSTREVSFPISVDDDAASKSYAIVASLKGLSYTNEAVSEEATFNVPVIGSGGSLKSADIANISIPNQVIGQEEFDLSFDVLNQSKSDLKNLKISVEVPEGLLNKTRSTFIESVIPASGSKNYSVKLFADDGVKEKSYPIKISVSSSSATDDSNAVIQYANVYVNGASGEKTPQLMVDSYSYGGTFVQAGDEFVLDLGLYNTSGTHTLSNIKVTVSSEDGIIIPVNSSNSFYLDKLGKKERTDQSLWLSVKPTAEQKTTALTVDMSYEDSAGNPFTSKDIISIPVMQETRLEVDEIIAPPELYAAMQSGLSVQFYNMGKTVLNNLRVTAEGDFDTTESTSYFVGNMEGGKSDTYDFSFIPRAGGPMEGKIIFTYEDAAGDQQILEKPFTFEVMDEMPIYEEEIPPEDMEGGGSKAPWIVGGILVLLAGGGVIAWRKIRRKKRNQEMEIDE